MLRWSQGLDSPPIPGEGAPQSTGGAPDTAVLTVHDEFLAIPRYDDPAATGDDDPATPDGVALEVPGGKQCSDDPRK